MLISSAQANFRLPGEFDCNVYRSCNPDLAAFSDSQLAAHYWKTGHAEGRRPNSLASRVDFAALIPPSARSLEIGPFQNPLLHGKNTKYFDVLPESELAARARSLEIDDSKIPNIDYASVTGDLKIIDETFDYILSSHCIEHQPDFIAHLRDVAALLREGGRYFVLVPDKRYCFDHFIAESTFADVLDAHYHRRKIHSLKSVLEHRVLTTHNDSVRHWAGDHGEFMQNYETRTKAALDEFNLADGSYIDVHAWFFTPQSMRTMLLALRQLQYTDLELEQLYPTRRYTNEFWCILHKTR